MRDENGRGVVRLHDKTTHGGEVITASDDLTALGVPVALEGHLTECPKCGGQFRIVPQGNTRRHHGARVAFHDDLTECGAQLISSLE
ncbi:MULTISPECIES: PAAR domain-containing protein [unclassified Burkholderia]|uniref:PAAR domain-containing protein n=1 Tax=unclassified Burkholderia TaxID=2613784 RepID=UPI000A05607B|nr:MULTISPECIES: PAAR domain-containing protein [unclassified Burkholderia]NIE85352.1 PAAR domain-containing protein [Burkholderia sp. Tr-860]NIF63731.1 PAAR domain-containing protein [Burkholderia sp. Cy-647]NIF72308.1 PAAR domain-containing protein [Burkholderia sp. Ap-962]NIF95522.1 PAAR domain-containing protein [Burkholderia sp. Ax-1720]